MGLTPLFRSNVALHGTFTLDIDTHLDYEPGASAIPETEDRQTRP
jgi:hypothetical protein